MTDVEDAASSTGTENSLPKHPVLIPVLTHENKLVINDSLDLEQGENWLRLVRRSDNGNSILDLTQDQSTTDPSHYPSILSLSELGGSINAPSDDCYICIDVDGLVVAIKDMRYPPPSRTSSSSSLEVCISRKLKQSKQNIEDDITSIGSYEMQHGSLEALPRRQMRILREGDRIITRSADGEIGLKFEVGILHVTDYSKGAAMGDEKVTIESSSSVGDSATTMCDDNNNYAVNVPENNIVLALTQPDDDNSVNDDDDNSDNEDDDNSDNVDDDDNQHEHEQLKQGEQARIIRNPHTTPAKTLFSVIVKQRDTQISQLTYDASYPYQQESQYSTNLLSGNIHSSSQISENPSIKSKTASNHEDDKKIKSPIRFSSSIAARLQSEVEDPIITSDAPSVATQPSQDDNLMDEEKDRDITKDTPRGRNYGNRKESQISSVKKIIDLVEVEKTTSNCDAISLPEKETFDKPPEVNKNPEKCTTMSIEKVHEMNHSKLEFERKTRNRNCLEMKTKYATNQEETKPIGSHRTDKSTNVPDEDKKSVDLPSHSDKDHLQSKKDREECKVGSSTINVTESTRPVILQDEKKGATKQCGLFKNNDNDKADCTDEDDKVDKNFMDNAKIEKSSMHEKSNQSSNSMNKHTARMLNDLKKRGNDNTNNNYQGDKNQEGTISTCHVNNEIGKSEQTKDDVSMSKLTRKDAVSDATARNGKTNGDVVTLQDKNKVNIDTAILKHLNNSITQQTSSIEKTIISNDIMEETKDSTSIDKVECIMVSTVADEADTIAVSKEKILDQTKDSKKTTNVRNSPCRLDTHHGTEFDCNKYNKKSEKGEVCPQFPKPSDTIPLLSSNERKESAKECSKHQTPSPNLDGTLMESRRKRKVRSNSRNDDTAKRAKSEATNGIRIVVTNVILTISQKRMIEKLGGVLLEKLSDVPTATHVIASDGKTSMRRTPKLMIGLCRTMNIIGLKWLTDSAKARKPLSTKKYLLTQDKKAEQEYDFSMQMSLMRADRLRRSGATLLGGWSVFVCKGVAGNRAPPSSELKLIIEVAGATWLTSLAPSKLKHVELSRTIIITGDIAEKQLSSPPVTKAIKQGAKKRTTSWLFHSIMTQQIEDLS